MKNEKKKNEKNNVRERERGENLKKNDERERIRVFCRLLEGVDIFISRVFYTV